MGGDESIDAARCTGEEGVGVRDGSSERAGDDASQIDKSHSPSLVDQFERNPQCQLDDDVEEDVVESCMDECISDVSPHLLSSPRVVDQTTVEWDRTCG